jgi:hypothetical protein
LEVKSTLVEENKEIFKKFFSTAEQNLLPATCFLLHRNLRFGSGEKSQKVGKKLDKSWTKAGQKLNETESRPNKTDRS